ncbi:torsin-1A-interacting protein 2-like [Chelmon rostratus]|uniref:torsin-1A-interacting protein 2-like n=1 Tax=Chelmon rostratus TaxID=109905 RepID=UPI001BE6FEBA|nr:torsin-1A-interacting protein 2-like [Chelmon rostratus]
MADEDTHQHTADVKEGETPSTNTDHVSASGKHKQEETGIDLNVKDSEDSDSAEEKMVPLAEGSSSPDEASTLTVEDTSTPPQDDDLSHGDYNRSTAGNEQQTTIGEYQTGEMKASKTATPPTEDDQVDGPNARLDGETTGTNNTDTVGGGEDDGSSQGIQEGTTSPQTASPQEVSDEQEIDEQTNNVENIGPAIQSAEHTVPGVTASPAGSGRYLIALGIVVVVAILVQHLLPPESPPQKNDMQQIDIFLKQMDKLKTRFPNQRAEVWNRSKIHLLRHLQTAQPTEPVSLILTAGIRAERTLRCLAQGLASAFSTSLNASVLHIDGVSKARQDSDQVKLDIDSKLQGAFEGDKPVAVIHRFEELPPGSTLIFYRYCDHENAAYKKTCLIFTVLLGEEEEIPAKSHLSAVEEMVDDHLQRKFISEGRPVSFDRMDRDKYGGLWSRISHLILPVTAEERMEQEGCKGT